MSGERYNTANAALETVSREEEAEFRRKYAEIAMVLDGTKISIGDFQRNPEEIEVFILDEKVYDREAKQEVYHEFATPAERMASDLRAEKYVREVLKRKSPEPAAALALEYIFGIGVKAGDWLGVKAEARAASTFDDTRYKIDEIITIDDKDDPVLPFGVDVTIATRPETMVDKLNRSSNNNTVRLPEGCSRVIYYEHGDERRSLPVVPRYVVAMQAGFVESHVRSDIQFDAAGNIGINPNAPRMMMVRQRILSELYAQAELRLNQLQLTPPQEMTDDEADAFDAIAAQKDIFDAALAKVEAALAERTPSLKHVGREQLRKGLCESSMRSDEAYAALMREVGAQNRDCLNRRIGTRAMNTAQKSA